MLTAKVTQTHDRITIAINEGKGKQLSMRWNRYSDSVSGKGLDLSAREMNSVAVNFQQLRDRPDRLGAKNLGEAANAIKALAEKHQTLHGFVMDFRPE